MSSFAIPVVDGQAGASAVFRAIDILDAEAAEHQRVLDENTELRERVLRLEAENAALRAQLEPYEWASRGVR